MRRILILSALALLVTCMMNNCTKEYDSFGTLYGVITDKETGNPISNASLVLSPGGNTKTTGEDGLFEFSELDPQQYTITVQKTDYQTNRKTIKAMAGEKTEANIPLTKSN
jgi:hypothetical protein